MSFFIFLVMGIFVASIILGLIKFRAVYYLPSERKDGKPQDLWSSLKESSAPWQWRFIEAWNHILNFLLAGLIGYYFLKVRLNPILQGSGLSTGDFILFFLFALCAFGWLPYLLKNITEGINAIFERILRK